MTVIAAAVHQGLRLYKRGLLMLGFAMDVLAANDDRHQAMEAFHELRSFNTGWKIRFHSMTSEHISHDETMRAVVERRNQLVKLSFFQPSKYSDLRIIHYELNSRLSKIELHTPVVGVVRRKNVSDLGKRYFESIISTALDVVDAEFSSNSEDSVTVLKIITEVVTKKMMKMNNVVSVSFEAEEVISSDDESDVDVGVDMEISNQIEEQMLLFPDKIIKHTVTEIESVVSLFIKTKSLYESKGEKLKNNSIARRMKNLVSSRPRYSDISIRSIKYWYVNSEKERRLEN